jgi:hypothetical protein
MMSRGVIGRVGILGLALACASCSDEDEDATGCGPETDQPPTDLACTGLYANFARREIAKTARPYAPAVSFWSDGYEKERWIRLPEGMTIDATNVDDWRFPVGTKVWKEFRFQTRKIETRLLWKTAEDRWVAVAYVWSEDGRRARRGEGSALTVGGAPYHVPDTTECAECHKGRKDTLLGFEAVSLAQPGATGLTLAVLAQESRLAPPPPQATLTIDPGLGVLHINCGVSCHNASPIAEARRSTLRLRVGFDEAVTEPVSSWELFETTVNVAATLPAWSGALRIAPGTPDESVIVRAMTTRGTGQMPPKAREVDFAGVAAVEAFVRGLPAP